MEGGLMKTILESVGLHWRMQAILEGGLVKTILELSPSAANCMQAILLESGL